MAQKSKTATVLNVIADVFAAKYIWEPYEVPAMLSY